MIWRLILFIVYMLWAVFLMLLWVIVYWIFVGSGG